MRNRKRKLGAIAGFRAIVVSNRSFDESRISSRHLDEKAAGCRASREKFTFENKTSIQENPRSSQKNVSENSARALFSDPSLF